MNPGSVHTIEVKTSVTGSEMLRDNRQIALNDVLLQAEQVAHHYRHSATLCEAENAELGEQLNALAAERETQAEALREDLLALQDLPVTADADRDTLLAVGERIAARWSQAGLIAILRERILEEERLISLIGVARDAELPEAVAQRLQAMADSVQAANKALTARLG